MRVALYARVSTDDKGQNPEVQLFDLRALALQRGWETVGEFVDIGVSGSKKHRPELDKVFRLAHEGKIDVVAVWKLDRFSRSAVDAIGMLNQLASQNVGFFSLMDPNYDLTTPIGRFIMLMMAGLAELERDTIKQRIKAGIAEAKRRGRKFGRPIRNIPWEIVDASVAAGMSLTEIADQMKIPRGTLRRRTAERRKAIERSIETGVQNPGVG